MLTATKLLALNVRQLDELANASCVSDTYYMPVFNALYKEGENAVVNTVKLRPTNARHLQRVITAIMLHGDSCKLYKELTNS